MSRKTPISALRTENRRLRARLEQLEAQLAQAHKLLARWEAMTVPGSPPSTASYQTRKYMRELRQRHELIDGH